MLLGNCGVSDVCLAAGVPCHFLPEWHAASPVPGSPFCAGHCGLRGLIGWSDVRIAFSLRSQVVDDLQDVAQERR